MYPIFNHCLSDYEESDWMLCQSQEVGRIIEHKTTSYKYDLSPHHEVQQSKIARFFLQRSSIDVFGRNRNFNECHKVFKLQCDLLNDMDAVALTKYPFLTAMLLEQATQIKHGHSDENYHRNVQSSNTTPDVVKRLEGLTLNSSGRV